MSTLPASIRTAILTIDPLRELLSSGSENRVAENYPRQEWFDKLFCVYTLRGVENEDTTDAPIGSPPFRQFWDLEFWGPSVGLAEQARLLVQGLHLYRGVFGTATVQGVFVTDQNSGYVPRSDYTDFHLHLAAADLEIVGYTGD